MDSSESWNFSNLKIEQIWLLKSGSGSSGDVSVINCVALVVRTASFLLLMHCLREAEFYDPFTSECSLHLWPQESGDISMAKARFKTLGVLGHMDWSERQGRGLILDLSTALRPASEAQRALAPKATIEVRTSQDTLQLTGRPIDIKRLSEN
jgi:hypothetical protein